MTHTPEPWKVYVTNFPITGSGVLAQGRIAIASPPTLVAVVAHLVDQPDESEANARRIVAAVNATAGIPTEALEMLAKADPHLLDATADSEEQP